ncbi:MAG TPA: isocitrate/isopropylmalate family dehydrogenase [Candidatus Bathyarchaeia archaeon]|nr:isocitrate/isopropylmalate family dehydrogenase [Candidatus Bathyarchaeia archaeon]
MKIAVAEGDGVGKEVIPPCVEILTLLLNDAEIIQVDIGYAKWTREGTPITDAELGLIKQADCMLLGAVTSVPGKSVVVRLRKTFDLFANLRPFLSYSLTPYELNLTIVRENLEGFYSGIEEVSADVALTKRVVSRANVERLASFASTLSCTKMVTIVHKANVLKSDIFFRDICVRILQKRGVPHNEMYVDAAAYNLIRHPEIFDHILTSNLFGDILSDEAAALIGGLGLCPSANIGPHFAIFEPVHGSAPHIAGRGIANPIGAILSTRMLLEWAGEWEKASLLDASVKQTIGKGIMTRDVGGSSSTAEVAREIIRNLR